MPETIQDVIDTIIASVPGAPMEGSVDTFKCGDPDREVTGIVATFTATLDVLRQAVKLGVNLIITHEPTFYEHRDATGWLADDPVYGAKRDFIEKNKLTIWRFHDYWHHHKPDGIIRGFLQEIGWEQYIQSDDIYTLTIPSTPVTAIAAILKQKLALSSIRVAGDPQIDCRRIGMLVGAWGGETQIKAFQTEKLDALICGETVEWQTCEYVRDAVASGQKKALIILGHANSEEVGMKYFVEWLRPKLADVPITFVAAGDPIQTL